MSIREQFGKTPVTTEIDRRAIRPVSEVAPPVEAQPVAKDNPLQGRTPYESMSYENDLTDLYVERIIEVHAQQIRTGFRRKEISAKWLARVLFRSNKTLCERYDRGTKVSEICDKELTSESDTLRDKLLELTPSARAKLIAELQGIDK